MNIQTSVKLIGGGAILLSAVLWSYLKIRAERRKTDELDAFCSLVRYIGANIEHFSRPLPEIYSDYSDRVLDAIGFTEAMREGGMKKAVERLSVADDKEYSREIGNFADKIGGGYREEQTELCAYTSARLTELLDSRRASARDKEKLCRTIPVLLALSVLLMSV